MHGQTRANKQDTQARGTSSPMSARATPEYDPLAAVTAAGGSVAAHGRALGAATGGDVGRGTASLLQLQGQYGNGYTQQVAQVAQAQPVIQPKLLLGPSRDPFEQEADHIAQRVSQGASAQGALTLRGPARGEGITPGVEQAIAGARGGGQPLEAGLRATMEGSFGADLSAVRVHTDARADSLNQALQARAFTTGSDIFFRRGNYAPAGTAGRALLAHELTHVVQQGAAPALAEGAQAGASGASSPAVVQRNGGDDNEAVNAPAIDDIAAMLNALEIAVDNAINDLADEEDRAEQARLQQDEAVDALDEATESAASYKDWAALSGMTLQALDAYAQTQADWHISPHLTPNQRQSVRTILAFAREPAILAGSGAFKVADVAQLITDKGEKSVFEALTEYSTAVKTQSPFELTPADSAELGVEQGADLKKLRAALGDAVLRTGMDDFNFKLLSKLHQTDSLITYYTTSQPTPIFQAHDGRDVNSFLVLTVDEKKDPLDYNKGVLKGKVRNYHRFEKDALDKLESNYQDKSKSKPLTLILHSALDHGGAFHRDKYLTDVITNAKLLTLMIEGKESLDDVKGELKPLAETYGMNDGIDQIMFAGHGDSRMMEMAGKVEEQGGQLKEVHDYMNLNDPIQKAKVDALFTELLNYLDKEGDIADLQPHQRAVFNACLTNSNVYGGQPLSWDDAAEARKQVREYLNQNASFATYFQKFADQGKARITSVGANASIRKVGLIDPTTDNLDMISQEDPHITAPKLTYVEKGTEPGGVMKAVLELWATDNLVARQALWEAMERRVKLPASKAWLEVIIRSLFGLILGNPTRGPLIHAAGDIATMLTHLSVMEDLGRPTHLWYTFTGEPLRVAMTKALFPALEGTDDWGKSDYLAVVLYQRWMMADPANDAVKQGFLARLGALTCQRASKFVKASMFHPIMGEMLAKPEKPGQLTLALLDVISGAPDAESKQFLIDHTVDDKFPNKLDVGKKVAGLATEDEILIAIGKKAKPDINNAVAPVPDAAGNVALGGADKNTLFLQSVTKNGEISAEDGANLYEKPDRTSTVLKVLPKGEKISIFGVSGAWLGIEYIQGVNARSAFIHRANVTIL